MRWIIILATLLGSSFFSVVASEGPISLIIADIQDKTATSAESIGIRDRVVSILVSRYDCHVLSRSGGFELAQESAISTMARINKNLSGKEEVVAADYGVEVEYENTDAAYVLIRPADLRSSSTLHTLPATKLKVSTNEPVEAIIADKIAERLSIPKRSMERVNIMKNSATNLTWCIFAFSRFDQITIDGKYYWPKEIDQLALCSDPEQLALNVEAAIQTGDRKLRLVDHKQLDSYLKERIVHALFNADSAAGTLGRIIGADRILTGFVSRNSAGKFRVDLHVVDTASSAVLYTGWEENISNGEIPGVATRLAQSLTSRSDPAHISGAASEAQRRKEAEFLLTSDFGSVMINSAAALSRKIHNAEACYLLTNNDRTFPNRIVEYLFNEVVKLASESDLEKNVLKNKYKINKTSLFSSVILPKQAVNLIDSIVRQTEKQDPSMAPFLTSAKAHYAIFDFAGAVDMIEKLRSATPNAKNRPADMLLVKCLFESGRTDKARAELEKTIKQHGENQETRQLALEINATSSGDEAKYKSLTSKVNTDSYQILSGEWNQWIQMSMKFEKPEKCIEMLDQWLLPKESHIGLPPMIAGLQEAMFSQAECYKKLGDKESAIQKCMTVIATLEPRTTAPEKKRCLEKAKNMLKELEADGGKVDFCFKKARTIRPFPEKYCMSIIPVEGVDTNTLNSIVNNLRDFFGARITVLPSAPIPKETAKAERHAYIAEDFMQKIIESSAFPEDNIFAVVVTKETLEERAKNYSIEVSGKMSGNPLLFSYSTLYRLLMQMQRRSPNTRVFMSSFDRLHLPEWKIIYVFRSLYSTNQCAYPCLFSDFAHATDELGLMCPTCQEEYKKADFDKIHNDLMDYLKKAGAKIVKAEGK